MIRFILAGAVSGFLFSLAFAGGPGLNVVAFKVNDVRREALIHTPKSASQTLTPVIFVFHGHGGDMKNAADSFKCHEFWPEAICVHMQGLPTPSKSDPKGERRGWQSTDGKDNRDLEFFDVVLKSLKADFKVDANRIYATGFSNGGGFTYLLWANRGDILAAVAPCAAVAGRKAKDLEPLPCLHIAGQRDDVVEFENQQKTIELIKKVNRCDAAGQPWLKKDKMMDATLYPSKTGAPFVVAIHGGSHTVPPGAGRLIVKFFKENPRRSP